MWRFKTTPMLVILRARGMIKNETDKDINNIPGNPSLNEIQNYCTLRKRSFPLESTVNVIGRNHPKEAVIYIYIYIYLTSHKVMCKNLMKEPKLKLKTTGTTTTTTNNNNRKKI